MLSGNILSHGLVTRAVLLKLDERLDVTVELRRSWKRPVARVACDGW